MPWYQFWNNVVRLIKRPHNDIYDEEEHNTEDAAPDDSGMEHERADLSNKAKVGYKTLDNALAELEGTLRIMHHKH